MAPGNKKRSSLLPQLKSTYVHPSLRPSSLHEPSDSLRRKAQTVNERIDFLRQVQASNAAAHIQEQSRQTDAGPVPSSSTRPSRTAGPKAPRSWTSGPNAYQLQAAAAYTYARRTSKVDYFPGVEFPSTLSLLHQALKSLAIDFDWHAEYDHVYLSMLPVQCKNLLLSYIAFYGPKDGISVNDILNLLCTEEELYSLLPASDTPSLLGATGCEELDRLDLAGSIGRKITIKQLDKCWHLKQQAEQLATPETWDSAEAIQGPGPDLHRPLAPRFPNLVKLSLANPGRHATWPELLKFSKHLKAITHLSLANWPAPSTSSTVVSDLPVPSANMNVLSPSLANSGSEARESMFDGASQALRVLSRNTPSLTFLSLAGCGGWFRALMHITTPIESGPSRFPHLQNHPRHPTRRIPIWQSMVDFESDDDQATSPHENKGCPSNAGYGVDWTRNWRHITQLDLSQSALPKALADQDVASPKFLHQLFAARHKLQLGKAVWLIGHGSNRRSTNIDVDKPDMFEYESCDYSPSCTNPVHCIARLAHKANAHLRPASRDRTQFFVASSNKNNVELVREREEARVWLSREVDAVDVESFVMSVRHLGAQHGMRKGKPIEVLHGWGRDELLACGYDEFELSHSGWPG